MNKRKQIIITHINNTPVCIYMIGDKIYDVIIDSKDNSRVGNIYVGRVDKTVKNISAAFIDIGDGNLGYLALSERDKDVIKPESEIVVQITKPAKKDKYFVLSRKFSLVGRYAVVEVDTTNIDNNGSGTDNTKIIRRTNSQYVNEDIFESEADILKSNACNIIEHAHQRTVGSLLYSEPKFYIKIINSYHMDELDRVVTDDREVYDEVLEYLSGFESDENSLNPSVEYYDDDYSIDSLYGISTEIQKSLKSHVWLDSGASLVIEHTEAATIVDVNSSKSVEGKKPKEETFLRINLEAADEIARQLRIRGISGIVLVDFIDMKKKESYEVLTTHIRKILKNDLVKADFVDFTRLGIAEITRAKRYISLEDAVRKIFT